MQTIAKRFLHLRKLTGMNQADFARQINLSQGRLSDIEKGKNKPSADTLISVVLKFSADATWLLMGSGTAPQTLECCLSDISDMSESDHSDTLDEEERKLISNYRLLNKENRAHIEKYMNFLIFEQQNSVLPTDNTNSHLPS